ncbi:MAG: Spore germination protein-like protein [Clostridia bacterium 41_269]|nr:MAG: Spore germination protein-like protein [Clostridia bacterium 41_269]
MGFLIAFLSLLLLSGCGMLGKQVEPTVEAEPNLASENSAVVEEGSSENTEVPGETIEVVLYFADQEGRKLVPEIRKIKKVEGLARAAINELIKGPNTGSGLQPTIPKGTVLNDINIKDDGLCIVDFNEKLIEKKLQTVSEELTVYSIVNTLTQFPTVDRVMFRIEGQDPDSMGSAILSSSPLIENSSLIKE